MRVSTPKMKGFESKSKFTERPEQSISSEQSTGPEFVKQPFPVKQFLLACVCVVLGAVSFWYLSSIASVDPDPLELSDSGLNFASINQVIE